MGGPITGLVALLSIFALAALLRLRQYAFAWGATADDLEHDWPGDELSPGARTVATRAISIDAPAEIVWGYIAQIGQDRAGFYSYTWLENLFGCVMPNVARIVPEWQQRTAGDIVWRARADRYHGNARLRIARLDPNRDLVLTSPEDWGRIVRHEHARDGAWSFVVVPTSSGTSKLIVRSRGPEEPGFAAALARALVLDPAHFIMERRMMRRIKALAENEARRGWREKE
jgi:hypothetical protein